MLARLRSLVHRINFLALILAAGPYAQAQPFPASVRLVPVRERETAESINFVGDVEPRRLSIVGTAVAGRVDTVLVEEGDRVKADQVLVELRKTTVSIEVDAAKAELDLREREFEELETGAREEEKKEAEALLGQAQSALNLAVAKLKRVEDLRKQRSATMEELDEAMEGRISAEHALAAAQAKRDLVFNGPRVERIKQAEARREMSRQEVARLEDRRKKYSIRSPFDGYVVQKHTEVGAWVSQADAIVEIVELDPIEVRVAVPEAYAGRIQIEQAAAVRVASNPDPNQDYLPARVFRLVPRADRRSRTFPVRLSLNNPEVDGKRALYPGMLAQVQFPVGKQRSGLFVPKDAIIWDTNEARLVVARPTTSEEGRQQMIASIIRVQIGLPLDTDIEVIDPTGTIQSGVMVVAEGNERVQPGQPLIPLPPAKPEKSTSSL